MIISDLLTFKIDFKNTSSKVIFNVSEDSLNQLTAFLRETGFIFKSVKQLRNSDGKFLKIPNQKLISIIDHHTELAELLTKKIK